MNSKNPLKTYCLVCKKPTENTDSKTVKLDDEVNLSSMWK